MRRFDVLVIGGGVAGLSTAYFLAKKGDVSVAVLEQEKKLGGHASGRNAGMLRQAVSDPALAELAVKSRRFFAGAGKKGWKGLNLEPNGSLLLASAAGVRELDAVENTLKRLGVRTQRFTKEQAVRKVPILSGGNFVRALFCPKDALVDIEALLRGFLYNLKKLGVPVLTGRRLDSVHAVQGGYLVQSGHEKYFAKKLVNAAGAWAGWVAEKAGAQALPLKAYRRHLFFTAPSRVEHWPFVWDLSGDLYFRPVGARVLLSPCDRTPEKRGDRREKVDPAMKKELYRKLSAFSGALSKVRVSEAKSGLRTMTPDGRFVIGEDVRRAGFFWVAGLGGHGVTTCFSVGELAADLVLGRKVESALFSPKRFLIEANVEELETVDAA